MMSFARGPHLGLVVVLALGFGACTSNPAVEPVDAAASGGRSGGASGGASGVQTGGAGNPSGGAGSGGASNGGAPGTGGAGTGGAVSTGGAPASGGAPGSGGSSTSSGGATGTGGRPTGSGGAVGSGGASTGGTTGGGGTSNCNLSNPVSFKKDVEPFLTNSCGKGLGSGCHVTDNMSTMSSGGFDHAYDWVTAGSHASSCPEAPNPKRFEIIMAVINNANPPSCSKSRKMPPPGEGTPPTACQLAALQAWLAEPLVTQMHRADDSSPSTPYPMPPFN